MTFLKTFLLTLTFTVKAKIIFVKTFFLSQFRFLKGLGKAAKIEKLCSITLRSLIETENVVTPTSDGRDKVSLHLGHSERTRDEFYVLPDRRQIIQSANRLLFLLEEAGESDDGVWCEADINESSDLVREYMVLQKVHMSILTLLNTNFLKFVSRICL